MVRTRGPSNSMSSDDASIEMSDSIKSESKRYHLMATI